MAVAGWYPVAPGSARQRYWDGSAWTEHFHEPAAQVVAVSPLAPAKAPEGTSPNTIWFWITAISPVVALIGLIPTSLYYGQLTSTSGSYSSLMAGASGGSAALLSTVVGLISYAVYILFPILDWRELGKRGVPRPFHWAWSLGALVLGSPIIYAIGRSVVVKRRTGRGLAPLWVFIGLQVVAWIATIIVVAILITALLSQVGDLLSSSGDLS